jgi:thymidylate kinase
MHSLERTVAIDGNDGTGKNTVFLTMAELAVKGFVELEGQPTQDLIFTNFPQYWSPLGTAIRQMNRGAAATYFANENYSALNELYSRAAMYALDRLFALLVIKTVRLAHPNAVQFSDRLYLANTNTAAYMRTRDKGPQISEAEFYEFVENGLFKVDARLIRELAPTTILCRTSNHITSGLMQAERALLDHLEAPSAQEMGIRGYEHCLQKLSSSQTPIIPLEVQYFGGQWRNKYVVAMEALRAAGFTVREPTISDFDTRVPFVNTLIYKHIQGEVNFIGPRLFARSLFKAPTAETNEINSLDSMWLQMTLFDEAELMHLSGNLISKKNLLDDMETMVACAMQRILRSEVELNTESLLQFPEILTAIKELVQEFNLIELMRQMQICNVPGKESLQLNTIGLSAAAFVERILKLASET